MPHTLTYPRSYAKGQTTTEIVESIKELYDVDISSSLVARVTDNILEDITAWQNRPLSRHLRGGRCRVNTGRLL
ncbi:transposase [Psychrobacter pacificensis]|uniref:transposase n=1 Tax=uncultured Psychrobacter sp. TaxID=259303 RepID=UPI002580E99B|nr:transposase [Psychrobacter sp. UBA2514]